MAADFIGGLAHWLGDSWGMVETFIAPVSKISHYVKGK
jgi:hypothetical protein